MNELNKKVLDNAHLAIKQLLNPDELTMEGILLARKCLTHIIVDVEKHEGIYEEPPELTEAKIIQMFQKQ